MKRAAIFYFSGTGNTRLVATMFKEGLDTLGCPADLFRIEDLLKSKTALDLSRYDLVGVGCQVIGFTAPRIVGEFLRGLPKAHGKQAFVFRTAGWVVPQNYNASKKMIRQLKRRGYAAGYERLFAISSNFSKRFGDAVVRGLYEATKRKVALSCQEILRGEKRIYETKATERVKMGLVGGASSFMMRIIGKDLTVKDSCTHCGLCVKDCPAGNIFEKNGKVGFKFSCTGCMRCVYACPQNAIEYKKFKSFKLAGGYDIDKILKAQEAPEVPEAPVKKPKFYDEYLANDSM